MKIKAFLIPLFFIIFESNAILQNVTIPDTNFKTRLIELGVDTNNDGEISFAEAEAVGSALNVSDAGIADLTGIEAFINVKFLNVNENLLMVLDVSNLSYLISLKCRQNYLQNILLDTVNKTLRTINLDNNQLISISFKDFIKLDEIHFKNNQLQSVELIHCGKSAIENLKVDFSENNIENIVISDCGDFNYLYLDHSDIESVSLERIRRIEQLHLENNSLMQLDLSSILEIDTLNISDNPDLDLVCAGITPPPFEIIDDNTPAYNIRACSPEPGDHFFAGQISNSFNYQYGFPIPFQRDTIDITGDGIADLKRWYETTTYPNGDYFTKYFIKGINNSKILSDTNHIEDIESFNMLDSPDFSWTLWQLYLGTALLETGGSGYGYNFNFNFDNYLAVRTITEGDTIYTWIQYNLDDFVPPRVNIRSLSSWHSCSSGFSLGNDTTITLVDTLIIDAGSGFDSYFWSTGDTTQSIWLMGSVLEPGKHMVTCLVSKNACNFEDTLYITISETGLVNRNNMTNTRINPNPATNFIYLHLPCSRTFDITVFGIGGEVVLKRKLSGKINRIDISGLKNGCYILSVVQDKNVSRHLFIKN